jgi:hypothetical protein
MKTTSYFFGFIFVCFSLLSCSSSKVKTIPRDVASLQSNGSMEGIWFLQGTNTTKGPYNGELELRRGRDGTYDAIRVITYINYYFDGLKVQEVWTGKALPTEDNLTITYDLKQAEFISRLDKKKRQATDFTNPISIISRYSSSENGLKSEFADRKEASYSEWITTRRDLESQPLWVNRRQYIDASGKSVPVVVRGAIAVAKRDIHWNEDKYVRSYSNRAEFKEERPTVIYDPTDADFYEKTKDTIRIVNKIADEISLTEGVVKRNAYAPSLEEKQRGYEKNTSDYHINELGMAVQAQFDERGKFISYDPDGDSALWTGMYVGSQAMRYLVTRDSEALFGVRKSLKGLFLLMDITGDYHEFARTVAVYDPARKWDNRWRRGTGEYERYVYMVGGNNDMLKGITHAFAWASLVIPENELEIWEQLRAKAKVLHHLTVVKEKPQNLAAAHGLNALINRDPEARKLYLESFRTFDSWVRSWFDGGFYWRGTADWSGINLSMVGAITNILIAERLEEDSIRDKLRDSLMNQWTTYQYVNRPLLTMTAYNFAYKHGARGSSFKSESSDQKFTEALKYAQWGLKEIPFPRPVLDVSIDQSLNPEWSLSPIPRLFWKAVKKPEPPVNYFYQGLYSYPAYEVAVFDSGMLWAESAFAYKVQTEKGLENQGIDYLYAYWMGRYSGLIKSE